MPISPTKAAPIKPILVGKAPRSRVARKTGAATETYDVSVVDGTIVRTTTLGTVENTEVRDLASFVAGIPSPIDTGFMPPNVLRYRQVGEWSQLVCVAPPAINRLAYSNYEGGEMTTFLVAQPYRVMIGDFQNHRLVGARHFYSPTAVATPDDVLYHTNLHNHNCMTYRDTSVGWVCLYAEGKDYTDLASKTACLLRVCSGELVYNLNMRSIDGKAFYTKHKAPAHVVDFAAWEKHTDKNGLDWATDPEIWIPVKVKDPASAPTCHDESGVEYTLHHAMDLPYVSAYHQPSEKTVQKGLGGDSVKVLLSGAFAKATPTAEKVSRRLSAEEVSEMTPPVPAPPKPMVKATVAKKMAAPLVAPGAEDAEVAIAPNPAAAPVIENNQVSVPCVSCGDTFTANDFPEDASEVAFKCVCTSCAYCHAYCVGCGSFFNIDDASMVNNVWYCPACVDTEVN